MTREPEEHLRSLADALEPAPSDVERLRARVHAADGKGRPRSFARIAPVALVAGAVAAGLVAWLSAPRDHPLGADPRWVGLARGIEVHASGAGRWRSGGFPALPSAGGGRKPMRIAWDQGELTTSVDPAEQWAVTVETDEALVRVLGTVFTVDRGPFGTEVSVSRGRVEVTCRDGAVAIGVGEAHRCPRDAAGALGYVLQLRAEPAEVIALTTRGLAAEGSEAVHDELRAARVEARLALGEVAEALADARALRSDTPTTRAVRQAAAVAAPSCAEAAPILQTLLPDPVAAVRLADCTTDPAERRRLLEAARPLADPATREAIDTRLARLPDAPGL